MTDLPRGLIAAGLVAACVAVATAPAAAETDFGVRYWYGFGETAKDLYDIAGTELLSRLNYNDLKTSGGELYGRIGEGGIFVKGFIGFGKTDSGNLEDEDFPPLDGGYSSTDSSQHGGKVTYGTIDIGHYFAGTKNTRLGWFVGFNRLDQEVSAFGCEQTAGNPFICVPSFDPGLLVITEKNTWTSYRLGASGDIRAGRVRFGGDAAIVYAQLAGNDSHWFRIGTNPGDFTGPIPEDGKGWGYQLEANVDLEVTRSFVVGAGVRYWHMQTRGDMHFEDRVVGVSTAPQRIDWQTTMWGVTVHAAWRF
jgi:outer membrane protease